MKTNNENAQQPQWHMMKMRVDNSCFMRFNDPEETFTNALDFPMVVVYAGANDEPPYQMVSAAKVLAVQNSSCVHVDEEAHYFYVIFKDGNLVVDTDELSQFVEIFNNYQREYEAGYVEYKELATYEGWTHGAEKHAIDLAGAIPWNKFIAGNEFDVYCQMGRDAFQRSFNYYITTPNVKNV